RSPESWPWSLAPTSDSALRSTTAGSPQAVFWTPSSRPPLIQAVTSLTAVCHPWHAPNHPWGAKTLHLVFIELLALPTPREKARHRLSNIHRTPAVNPASGPPPLASWALRINLLFVLSPFFAEKFPVMP